MPVQFARREILAGMVALTAAKATSRFAPASRFSPADASSSASPFRVSVINDEISQDFGHACEVASHEFGMGWIELRSMWKKNIVALDEKEVAEARRIVEKYRLKVTDIASPLFKVDWPGAPKSKFSEAKSFGADFKLSEQDEVLDRAIVVDDENQRTLRPALQQHQQQGFGGRGESGDTYPPRALAQMGGNTPEGG